jgi:recombination protein RecR
MTAQYPQQLLKLMAFFKMLPGVGGKTAERFAFHLLGWEKEKWIEWGHLLSQIPDLIDYCAECGCLKHDSECAFCFQPSRQTALLCLVSSIKDVFALEQTRSFRGLYHVLGGLLSPIDNMNPEKLSLESLKKRIVERKIEELIIALDSTIEGDTTALYIKQMFQSTPLRISRLAFGIPMGSPLDFIDGGTLARALSGRQFF